MMIGGNLRGKSNHTFWFLITFDNFLNLSKSIIFSTDGRYKTFLCTLCRIKNSRYELYHQLWVNVPGVHKLDPTRVQLLRGAQGDGDEGTDVMPFVSRSSCMSNANRWGAYNIRIQENRLSNDIVKLILTKNNDHIEKARRRDWTIPLLFLLLFQPNTVASAFEKCVDNYYQFRRIWKNMRIAAIARINHAL